MNDALSTRSRTETVCGSKLFMSSVYLNKDVIASQIGFVGKCNKEFIRVHESMPCGEFVQTYLSV